jgi:hypothetical protein
MSSLGAAGDLFLLEQILSRHDALGKKTLATASGFSKLCTVKTMLELAPQA